MDSYEYQDNTKFSVTQVFAFAGGILGIAALILLICIITGVISTGSSSSSAVIANSEGDLNGPVTTVQQRTHFVNYVTTKVPKGVDFEDFTLASGQSVLSMSTSIFGLYTNTNGQLDLIANVELEVGDWIVAINGTMQSAAFRVNFTTTNSTNASINDIPSKFTIEPPNNLSEEQIVFMNEGEPSADLIAELATSQGVGTNGIVVVNSIPKYGDTSGRLIKDSGVFIDDSKNVSGVKNLGITGILTIGSAATNYTLPISRGTLNQVLTANANGGVDWKTTTGGGGVSNPSGVATINAISRFDTTDGQQIKDSLILLDNSGNMTGAISISSGSMISPSFDTSSTLQIGPTTATKVELAKTGITTEVKGTLNAIEAVTFGTGGTNYIFPTTRGTSNQILVTNASGVVNWQNQVTTPGSSTNNAIVKFSGTSGSVFANSGVTIDGSNNLIASALKSASLDTETAVTCTIGAVTATKLELAKTGVTTEIKGPFNPLETITVGTAGTNYTLPTVRGTDRQILQSNASGVVSFSDPSTQSSTGVISGGILSINGDNTKFDITAGVGQIIDISGSVTNITWNAMIALGTTYSGITTYVSLDSTQPTPSPVYSSTPPTNTSIRNNIYLGVLIHINAVNIIAIDNQQMVLAYPTNQIRDFMEAVGFINIDGNLLSAASNNLSFAKSDGNMLKFGANYINNIKDPHVLNLPPIDTNTADPADNSNSFSYRMQNGTSSALGLKLLQPTILDNGTNYPGGTMTGNRWGSTRVYQFVDRSMKLQPPQFEYKTLALAIESIPTEAFVVEPSIAQNGMLIGYIVANSDTVNLANTVNVQFVAAGKFGSGISSIVGGTQSLQSVYDNSTNPEIITATSLGALTVQRGSTTDTDNIFEGKNGVGTTTFSVDGNGRTTMASFNQPNSFTPASAGAIGTTGDYAWDTAYFYICTGTNTWRRMAHASW